MIARAARHSRGTGVTVLLMLVLAELLAPPTLMGSDVDVPADVESFQELVVAVVEKTRDAFVCVGGGSGVIISPDGWGGFNRASGFKFPLVSSSFAIQCVDLVVI